MIAAVNLPVHGHYNVRLQGVHLWQISGWSTGRFRVPWVYTTYQPISISWGYWKLWQNLGLLHPSPKENPCKQYMEHWCKLVDHGPCEPVLPYYSHSNLSSFRTADLNHFHVELWLEHIRNFDIKCTFIISWANVISWKIWQTQV